MSKSIDESFVTPVWNRRTTNQRRRPRLILDRSFDEEDEEEVYSLLYKHHFHGANEEERECRRKEDVCLEHKNEKAKLRNDIDVVRELLYSCSVLTIRS